MNIFRPYTFKWWQISILKGTMTVFGIIIGVCWADFFEEWMLLLWVLFVVGVFLLLPLAWKNIK